MSRSGFDGKEVEVDFVEAVWSAVGSQMVADFENAAGRIAGEVVYIH